MAVTTGLIKELRERTGAGMLDCKKALEENAGDIEKSIDWLREKGIANRELVRFWGRGSLQKDCRGFCGLWR